MSVLVVENPNAFPAQSSEGYSGFCFGGWHDRERTAQVSHDASARSWLRFLVLVHALSRGADELARCHLAECLHLLSRGS